MVKLLLLVANVAIVTLVYGVSIASDKGFTAADLSRSMQLYVDAAGVVRLPDLDCETVGHLITNTQPEFYRINVTVIRGDRNLAVGTVVSVEWPADYLALICSETELPKLFSQETTSIRERVRDLSFAVAKTSSPEKEQELVALASKLDKINARQKELRELQRKLYSDKYDKHSESVVATDREYFALFKMQQENVLRCVDFSNKGSRKEIDYIAGLRVIESTYSIEQQRLLKREHERLVNDLYKRKQVPDNQPMKSDGKN